MACFLGKAPKEGQKTWSIGTVWLILNSPWLPPIQPGKQPFAPTVRPLENRGYMPRIWDKNPVSSSLL